MMKIIKELFFLVSMHNLYSYLLVMRRSIIIMPLLPIYHPI
jgi:hypothetical protein